MATDPPDPDDIRRARERLGLSQPELGDLINASESSISNWERGVTKPRSHLGKLIEVLSLDRPAGPVQSHEDAELWALLYEVLAEIRKRSIGIAPTAREQKRWPGRPGVLPPHMASSQAPPRDETEAGG